ncbi:unnamed protein product [Amoebophrya sp. A120]|nr:unnamed protein product [Amoebophrya sp. A120]|eukprot:GSA120T00006307001.1
MSATHTSEEVRKSVFDYLLRQSYLARVGNAQEAVLGAGAVVGDRGASTTTVVQGQHPLGGAPEDHDSQTRAHLHSAVEEQVQQVKEVIAASKSKG